MNYERLSSLGDEVWTRVHFHTKPSIRVMIIVERDDKWPSMHDFRVIARGTHKKDHVFGVYVSIFTVVRPISSLQIVRPGPEVFKALQILDYCLHSGSQSFLGYTNEQRNRESLNQLNSIEIQDGQENGEFWLGLIRSEVSAINNILDSPENLDKEIKDKELWINRVTTRPRPDQGTTFQSSPFESRPDFGGNNSGANQVATAKALIGEGRGEHLTTLEKKSRKVSKSEEQHDGKDKRMEEALAESNLPGQLLSEGRDLKVLSKSTSRPEDPTKNQQVVAKEVAKGDKERRSKNWKPEPLDKPKTQSRLPSDLVRDSRLQTEFVATDEVWNITFISSRCTGERRTRKVEKWKRVRELGAGTFGRVWLEKSTDEEGNSKHRAVKEICKRKDLGIDHNINYGRELEAIAKFSHAKYVHCFVESFGWYDNDKSIFIAMEYLEKGDLQSFLSRPFPEVEARLVASQVLEGLCFMHENGFAHRDLKPANILVSEPSPNWWVKISDFGISKRVGEEFTALRTMIGTMGYLAPEVLGILPSDGGVSRNSEDQLYTVAVDVWAMGAIVYRIITEESAFPNFRSLSQYAASKKPFSSSLLVELGVSSTGRAAIENMMTADPDLRPSAAQTLASPWFSDAGLVIPDLLMTDVGSLARSGTGPTDSLYSAQWPTMD